ncbi:hypothetical protein JHK87_034737 [Glycine soja]|nr:hypothetical protein JHK87_034737 [Glycine soja]
MEKFFNPSGTSLLVPSVQELATRNLSTVPQRYIQHQHEDMVLLSEEANSSLEIFQLLTCRACFLQNLGLQNWLSFTLLARNGDSSRWTDYKHWLAAQNGLPPVEEWRENLLQYCFRKLIEFPDKYKDQWDDAYWDAIIQTTSASQNQR